MKKSLFALALGTLGLGITEYVMMGVLPDTARSLHITIPQAGHFISAYALGVGVGAILTFFTARTKPLKQILLGLMLVFTLGNLFTSASPNYWIMLILRFISGLPHGAYFGVGSIVAERLAQKGKETQAVSAMISGMTIANLIGVPLGTFLSHSFSWRIPFFFAGVFGLVILYAIKRWVPYMDAIPDTGLKNQVKFLKSPVPWILIFAVILGNGGIFCWYSYISPLMVNVSGFSSKYVTWIMFIAGLGMVLGNILSGKLSDKFSPDRVAASVQAIACISLLLIFFFAHNPIMSVILMFIVSGCLFALGAPQQILLNRNSHGGQMLGAASAQVAFNLGNAIGAYCGGIPIDMGFAYNFTALPGMVFALAGFLLLFYFSKKYNNSTCGN